MIPRAMLRLASLLVPLSARREWLDEWTAELSYVLRSDDPSRAPAFCSGAFPDALEVRRQAIAPVELSNLLRPTSPIACLATLALLAFCSACVMWRAPAVQASMWPHPIQVHLRIAAGALILYPLLPGSRGFDRTGLRGWCFLAAKVILLMPLVFFASFDIVPLISRGPIPPQLALIMYILAWRWAIEDQRRRCPVCLRLLTNPVHIGNAAGTLLEWYGAELMCSQGHGVMHEPESLTSSYCARRWVRLDASWQELF